jgi:lipoprotein-releasing system permease protein
MYKLLLCWRYLRTRYIALASIISVTLGVATMIVVNAVMAGFTREMQDRIKGILSDISFEARSLEGVCNAELHKQEILRVAGEDIESMTVTVLVPAMLSFQVNGQWITRPVQLIGVEETTKSDASKFGEYLQHPDNRRQFSFALRESGYDIRDPQGGPEAPLRRGMERAGARWRRERALRELEWRRKMEELERQEIQNQPAGPAAEPGQPAEQGNSPFPEGPAQVPADDPFAARGEPEMPQEDADPGRQNTGCVLGMGLVSFRRNDEEHFLLLPGDDVKLTFPTAGTPPKAVSDVFTVVDFYESKMSEYDSSFVFVPIEKIQELRGMFDPQTGERFFTSIQIRLKDESRSELVRDKLQQAFPSQFYSVQTWRDKQGPLLAAVQMETAILNVLLFLIIAVAGFGILAIFFMIVVEKTKDIGILKSLGAHRSGVAGIFLSYGLSLGLVGAGAGLVMGLLLVTHINEVADLLSLITGHQVFDPEIYYFYRIPTLMEPWTVTWIVLGALLIAVLASVLPALRAANLHPVEALRYE